MAKRFTRVILTTWLAVFVVLMLMARGQEEAQPDAKPADAPAGEAEGVSGGTPEVTELLSGLRMPTSLAVRPGSGPGQTELWVADGGHGKVVRYQSASADAWNDAIVELGEQAEEGEDRPSLPRMGVAFQSRNRLILSSTSGTPLRVFEIDDDKLPSKGDAGEVVGEPKEEWPGGLADIARNEGAFFFVGSAGDRTDWVALSPLKGANLGPIEKFRQEIEGVELGNLRAITFSAKRYLVAGFAGDESEESLLVFLDPHRADFPAVMVLRTGLADIASLAYHPKTGSLYAADSAWGDAEKGGVYRLDAKSVAEGGNESCEAVLIAKLPYATAIDFDSSGNLYAVSASSPDGAGEPTGKLIKVTGE